MRILIANPPIGIYKPFTLGHAGYHVWLDILKRQLTFQGNDVLCHKFSLNSFGKGADIFEFDDLKSNISRLLEKAYSKEDLRNKLNLSLDGIHLDSNEDVVSYSIDILQKLNNRGFIINDGKDLFLDMPKIASKQAFFEEFQKIDFFPHFSNKIFDRLLRENSSSLVRITRDSRYSPSNSLSSNNLGPLFVLANSWDIYNVDNIIMTTSNNTLAKYVLLRYAINIALTDSAGMNSVYIFPKLLINETIARNISTSIESDDSFSADIFKYACIKAHTMNSEYANLQESNLIGGKKLINKILNLDCFFRTTQPYDNDSFDNSEKLSNFQFTNNIQNLEKQIYLLSRDISKYRNSDLLTEKKSNLKSEYLLLLEELSSFMPDISQYVISAGNM